ncbi:hypothetical protein BVX99_03315 [bacterium F16]|nr:hypothetical protein BVX99_03315 [bacterium F16]
MNRHIAFVPVRGGSKGIPGKNIKLFCDKPLVYWVLKRLEDASSINIIYVATDCPIIAKTIRQFSLSKVNIFHRSDESAQDDSPTEHVLLEFLEQTDEIQTDDTIVLVQATTPTLQTDDIDNMLHFYDQNEYDSCLSCVRVKRFFWDAKGLPVNYDYTCRPRRQEFEGSLMENGAIYINNAANIIKHKNRLSGRIGIYEMPEISAVEIDEELDWVMAEKIMKTKILC